VLLVEDLHYGTVARGQGNEGKEDKEGKDHRVADRNGQEEEAGIRGRRDKVWRREAVGRAAFQD
jgi:hypothetical protein